MRIDLDTISTEELTELLTDRAIECDSCADCPYSVGDDAPNMATLLRATAERMGILQAIIDNKDQIIALLEGRS